MKPAPSIDTKFLPPLKVKATSSRSPRTSLPELGLAASQRSFFTRSQLRLIRWAAPMVVALFGGGTLAAGCGAPAPLTAPEMTAAERCEKITDVQHAPFPPSWATVGCWLCFQAGTCVRDSGVLFRIEACEASLNASGCTGMLPTDALVSCLQSIHLLPAIEAGVRDGTEKGSTTITCQTDMDPSSSNGAGGGGVGGAPNPGRVGIGGGAL